MQLTERVRRFIEDPASGSFDELAAEVFAYQYASVPPYRRLCEARGASPGETADWRRVPLVPTLAFKTLALHAAPAVEVFRSSGTRLGEPSVHYHPFPDLYRSAVDASFPHWCLGGLQRPPMLSLVPSRHQAPDSSLAFMVAYVMERYGADDSVNACGPRGVDVAAARSWLAARQRDRRPAVLLATSLALLQLLEALERRYLHFRLPPGSVVFDTGGYKGHHLEVTPAALLERLTEQLGIEPSQVVREYGMSELSSQCYTGTLHGGPPDLFHAPHWMQVRILEPESLSEVPEGERGLLSFFDLANLGSAAAILSEDLGMATRDGFHLLGRAEDSELRGCSLTVEELATGGV